MQSAYRQQVGTSPTQGLSDLFNGAMGVGAEKAAVAAHTNANNVYKNHLDTAEKARQMAAQQRYLRELSTRDSETANAMGAGMVPEANMGDFINSAHSAFMPTMQNQGLDPAAAFFQNRMGTDPLQQDTENRQKAIELKNNSIKTLSGSGSAGGLGGQNAQGQNQASQFYFHTSEEGALTPAQQMAFQRFGGSRSNLNPANWFREGDATRVKDAQDMMLAAEIISNNYGMPPAEAMRLVLNNGTTGDAADGGYRAVEGWSEKVDEALKAQGYKPLSQTASGSGIAGVYTGNGQQMYDFTTRRTNEFPTYSMQQGGGSVDSQVPTEGGEGIQHLFGGRDLTDFDANAVGTANDYMSLTDAGASPMPAPTTEVEAIQRGQITRDILGALGPEELHTFKQNRSEGGAYDDLQQQRDAGETAASAHGGTFDRALGALGQLFGGDGYQERTLDSIRQGSEDAYRAKSGQKQIAETSLKELHQRLTKPQIEKMTQAVYRATGNMPTQEEVFSYLTEALRTEGYLQ